MIEGWKMEVGIRDVMAVLGFTLAIAGQTWAIIHYLINRMDRQKKEIEDKIDADKKDSVREDSNLHNRINEVKDHYVKRTELDREFSTLQKGMTDMKADFHIAMQGINTRIDQVIAILSRNTKE